MHWGITSDVAWGSQLCVDEGSASPRSPHLPYRTWGLDGRAVVWLELAGEEMVTTAAFVAPELSLLTQMEDLAVGDTAQSSNGAKNRSTQPIALTC